jgi:hypothetical protein
MAISKLLIICLYQVTKNRYLSKQHSVLPMKQLILYILLSFCSIVNICLNAKIGYSVTIPETDKYIGYLTIIITVFINLHIMWLLEYIIENQKLKSKIARSEQQANLQLKYYKQLDANRFRPRRTSRRSRTSPHWDCGSRIANLRGLL